MGRKHLCLLFVLFALNYFLAEAQLFKPFTTLRVIKTEHFDIIFPSESELSARELASYADSVYARISALLGIEVPGRIPVTFVPHTDLFNGYYNSISIPHITLYDTPMDLEWTNFANSLEALFIHELTHAISLNTRTPFFSSLRRVFGNWVSPSFINAPLFMVEGVTVSAESLSGFGRANDPLIKQKLRQAIYEDRFPTPFQTSGVYDVPGQGSNWYEYGGLFSTWLIQNYGMEKYAELWQAMGKLTMPSFSVYRSGYYRVFYKTYGIFFQDAWKAFRDALALRDLEKSPDDLLPKQRRFFSEKRKSISALAAGKTSVYILDSNEEKIRVYQTLTGNIRTFNTNFHYSYDIDVSSDETKLLVSGYHRTGERYMAIVSERDTVSGRKTGRTIDGLYKARYFRDGIIGIRSELHNTCIVYEDFSGNSEILFRGDEKLLFSGPQAVDERRIAFIAARDGNRELLIYDYVTGELSRVEDSSGACEEYWRYIRGLGVSAGKLFFSYNADDRMYKLSVIDLDEERAVFSGRDFSGGVFHPVCVDDSVYYSGAFFSGDSFSRFPEKVDELSGIAIEINSKVIPGELYGLQKGKDHFTAEYDSREIEPSEPYIGIAYMNPFNFWLPLPLVRYSFDIDDFYFKFDGAGLFSVMTDPTDRNLLIVTAYADITYRMAAIENFSWRNTFFGFPMTLDFSDIVKDVINRPYRDTRVTLGVGLTRYPGKWAYGFSLDAGYVRFAFSDGEKSAYQWDKTEDFFFFRGNIFYSSLKRRQNELFGKGISLNLKGASLVNSFSPRVEVVSRASAENIIPLSVTLYGAYDDTGMNLHGESKRYGQPLFKSAAPEEYSASAGYNLKWLAGGELSAGLFSFEIQRNLSHIYFNRVYGSLSVRSAIYDNKDMTYAEGVKIGDTRLAQSLVLKIGFMSSAIPVKSNPVFIEPAIWGAWKFSNAIAGNGSLWGYGFGFSYRF